MIHSGIPVAVIENYLSNAENKALDLDLTKGQMTLSTWPTLWKVSYRVSGSEIDPQTPSSGAQQENKNVRAEKESLQYKYKWELLTLASQCKEYTSFLSNGWSFIQTIHS